MEAWLHSLAARHSWARVLQLGSSHEAGAVAKLSNTSIDHKMFCVAPKPWRRLQGRAVLALQLGETQLGSRTPTVLLDGGMHAREWITPAVSLLVIAQLVKLFKGRRFKLSRNARIQYQICLFESV